MKKIATFHPWKKDITDNLLEVYKHGVFPVLMLDMKPRCTIKSIGHGGCVYCMAREVKPGDHSLSKHRIKEIIWNAAEYGVDWLYICGASEPFDDVNSVYAIEQAFEAGLEICAYTNALSISHKFAKWLFKHEVNLIVKCDSLNDEVFNALMRAKVTQNFAQKVYKSIHNLIDAGYGKADEPSMALSIVTTSANSNDIPDVVEFCLKSGFFPLIRHAKISTVRVLGNKQYRASSSYRAQNKCWHLPTDEKAFLKAKINDIIGEPYETPLCPTAIAGIHVTYSGKVKIDSSTGLSCTAFTKRRCKQIAIGNVETESIEEIAKKILSYRESVLHNVELKRRFRPVFGGCGGTNLLSTYYKILKAQSSEVITEDH